MFSISNRRLTLVGIVTLMLTALVALFVATAANSGAEQRALGKRLYDQYCASCHGLRGEGQYPDAPYRPDKAGLIGAPPHNSTGHSWHHPDGVLFSITKDGLIIKGFHPMPTFGDKLTDDDIWAVLAYIKTWWKADQVEFQKTVTARHTPPAK
jgi:mono/diheme cytochrome c family protein